MKGERSMQNEWIVISEYCDKCHIEPTFIDMLCEVADRCGAGRWRTLSSFLRVAGCGTVQPYVLRPFYQYGRD